MTPNTLTGNVLLPAESKKPKGQSWLNSGWIGATFISPTMLLLLFITVFPLIWSLYLSFTDYSINSSIPWTEARWIGLENYTNLLNDPSLWQRFSTSALFVIPTVTLEFLLGFGIALLLNRDFFGRGIVTTLIIIPMMLTAVVVGLFWRFMFQADIGIINVFIRDVLNLPAPTWLTDQTSAIASLVITDVWQWTPYIILIALAGLQTIPKYLYEASSVDGANRWNQFLHITLPIMAPILLIAVLFRLTDTFKLFDLPWILTGGFPDTTKVLPIHLYKEAFSGQFKTGEVSAMGYMMLVVIIALANLLIRVLNAVKSESGAESK